MAEVPNPVTLCRQIANELARRAYDLLRAVERHIRGGWQQPGPRDN